MDVVARAQQLLREWEVDALPDHLRRNSLDHYYLSVWPGLADLDPVEMLDLPPRPARTASGYVHLPFCSGRCDFCSYFLTVARDRDPRIGVYLDDLLRELEVHQRETEVRLTYLYLGGGTPSLLPPDALARLLDGFDRAGALADGLLGTMELHPELFADPARADAVLDVLAAHGIRRVSLGYQSDDPDLLDATNRRHGSAFLADALERLRAFTVNVDLMYGLPGQSVESWVATVASTVALRPDSVSTYFLFVDHGTRTRSDVERGRVRLPDHLQIQTQHLAGRLLLEEAGHHELPGDFFAVPAADPATFTQDALPSRANSLALGAGAYGYFPGVQHCNHFDFAGHAAAVRAGRSPRWRAAVLTPHEELCRDVMFSVKNAPLLDRSLFRARHGVDVADLGPMRDLEALGLLVITDHAVRLTDKGRLVGEEIACAFAPPRSPARPSAGREATLLRKHHFAPTYGIRP